jgi:hypothetical protein
MRRRCFRTGTALGLSFAALLFSPDLFGSVQKKGSADSADTAFLLARTAEYCRRLKGAILDYFCREEVEEIYDPLLDELKPFEMALDWARIPPGAGQPAKRKSVFSYDYQYIRSGPTIRERRRLLKANGERKDVPDAPLLTAAVAYGNALLTPTGLFDERFQGQYSYVPIGRDRIDRHSLVVMEIKPNDGAAEAPCAFGKAWLDPQTADIWRIEWRDREVRNWDVLEARGKRFLRQPRLTMRSDFTAEKNGIRFPSRLTIEEAYIGASGRGFVRSLIKVAYTDFVFFTVDVQVATDPRPAPAAIRKAPG